MTQQIKHRLVAVPAIVPGLLTIKGGGSVLLGSSIPSYHVLPWLVVYNVVLGFVSLIAGTGIWMERTWGSILAAFILLCHSLVFLIVFFLLLFREPVALISVMAMLVRTALWAVIYLLLRWAGNVEAGKA